MRNYTKLLELAKQNNGYVFTKDLSQNKIAKDYLKFAVEDRILEKVARGIYIESDKFVDLLYVYQMNYSKIVFSSFTSAYLWNLTTRDTEIIYGATPLNYFAKYSHNNTVLVRENDDIYNLGITTIKTMFGNIVKCHDIHRTICDLFSDKYVGDRSCGGGKRHGCLLAPDFAAAVGLHGYRLSPADSEEDKTDCT